MKSTLSLLEESPFFEDMDRIYLERLAEHARLERVVKGAFVLRAGDPAEALHMLVSGSVELCFEAPEMPHVRVSERARRIPVRTIAEPGRVVGWSALVEPYHYRATVIALDDSQLFAFDREWLESYMDEEPPFGLQIMERILWALGNRLRESRIRLLAQRYEQEILTVRALLDQSAEELSVESPLHKIPFYLQHRMTLSDAFHTLELLRVHGDELERNLAGLCLDTLENVRRELSVYQQLQAIYEHVANAPPTAEPSEIRRRCCEDFITLFEDTSYVIKGEEYLPESPGCIFIMNHLDNHPDNTLPNDFRLTLDTHFVASMIVYRRYGDAPIRVIRKSRPDEFGHQKYYDRLGYIYVYSGHVDEDLASPEELAKERRMNFFAVARSCLLNGDNLVICPEGGCTRTETSPLPFKVGAFRLASLVEPEPWIVPVAVANFDDKITRATLVAEIHQPFRLSDSVPKPLEDEALFTFVNSYQKTFSEYVRAAAALAADRGA